MSCQKVNNHNHASNKTTSLQHRANNPSDQPSHDLPSRNDPMKRVTMGGASHPAKRCVISLAIGRKGLAQSLERLEESLTRVRFKGDFLAWNEELPLRSPTQFEAPMAFKTFCFLEARKRGYEEILWMDATIVALRPVEPIFQTINEHGYVAFCNNYGQSLGQWSSDEVLQHHCISREEAMKIPEIPTSVIGVNVRHESGIRFLEAWHALNTDGLTCRGGRTPITTLDEHYAIAWNKGGCISSDPRVGGHRFDQTAAGIIFHQLGMRPNEDSLRDIHHKERAIERETILLHHREFKEEITPLNAIYRKVFFTMPYLDPLRSKARRLIRFVRRVRRPPS
ncbi:hypothetical protein KBZ12_03655 [Cyanobium sp. Cruz CV13-4-11]|jgi:hypothetical protein|nr:hypothetical protein [Cyanobium sp. Cruz CV13-4-11]